MRASVGKFVLAFLLITSIISALELEDLSQNSFTRMVLSEAKRHNLNVVVCTTEKELDSSLIKTEEGLTRLEAMAAAVECRCFRLGDLWLIVDEKDAHLFDPAKMSVYFPRNCPVVCLKKELNASFSEAEKMEFLPQENLIAISGSREHTARFSSKADALDFARSTLRINLSLDSDVYGKIPQVAMLTFVDAPCELFVRKPEGKELSLKILPQEISPDQIQIVVSIYEGKVSNKLVGVVKSEMPGNGRKNCEFNLQSATGKLSGIVGAEVIRKANGRASRKIEERISSPKREVSYGSSNSFMNLNFIREPLADVCARIVEKDGENFCSGKWGERKVSLFCFGEELYFEEILHALARVSGLIVRKIGNTWILASPEYYSDTFESGLYITRSFQFKQAKTIESPAQRILAGMGLAQNSQIAVSSTKNALVCGGTAIGVESMKKLVELVDTTPCKVDLKIVLQTDREMDSSHMQGLSGEASRWLVKNSAKEFSGNITPVKLNGEDKLVAEYNCNMSLNSTELALSGWMELENKPEYSCVEIENFENKAFKLRISGKTAQNQLETNSEKQSFEPDEPENMELDADSEYDEAFESSF